MARQHIRATWTESGFPCRIRHLEFIEEAAVPHEAVDMVERRLRIVFSDWEFIGIANPVESYAEHYAEAAARRAQLGAL